ncbi:MAG: dCTP deaminase domain-containing protein [Pseudonocardiaceae bacterium]
MGRQITSQVGRTLVILTGNRIATGVQSGQITIRPYSPKNLEPNSYGVTLGGRFLDCATESLDVRCDPSMSASVLKDAGRVLEPGRFYLGETGEVLGRVTRKVVCAGQRRGCIG